MALPHDTRDAAAMTEPPEPPESAEPPEPPVAPDEPAPPTVTSVLARLVRDTPLSSGAHTAAAAATIYRPLIVGPAILRRPAASGEAWLVSLVPGPSIRPRCPGSRTALVEHVRTLRAAGVACRVAAALVAPEDVRAAHDAPATGRSARRGDRCRAEFYGWSLLYRPAGSPRTGLVEPHPTFPDLPAFFQSPAELLERSASLAARGVPSRPLALFTQPEDFDEEPDGTWLNRYVAAGTFRHATRLNWLG
jgi:hypothetical protein